MYREAPAWEFEDAEGSGRRWILRSVCGIAKQRGGVCDDSDTFDVERERNVSVPDEHDVRCRLMQMGRSELEVDLLRMDPVHVPAW